MAAPAKPMPAKTRSPQPSAPAPWPVQSHPGAGLLAQYYHCRLSPGFDLAVEAHIDRCAHCRNQLAAFDATDLAQITDTDTPFLSDEALFTALRRIDALEAEAPGGRREPSLPAWLQKVELPNTLDRSAVRNRHWPAPGVWIAPIALDGDARGARTYLISVKAGMAVPQHAHSGRELTVVLSGVFADDGGTYGPGDLLECAGHHSHAPGAVSDCVCLIAAEAPVVMQTWLGRLIQPLARI